METANVGGLQTGEAAAAAAAAGREGSVS